jgi:dTDP-4-amino-4,6-dideoxygalactose transaminase
MSIPEHPYYQQSFGWKPEDYPNAMRVGRQTISLPLSAKLTDADVGDVIDVVRKTLTNKVLDMMPILVSSKSAVQSF